MALELLLAILLGVLAGCFTGLIPGVHVNLLAAMLIAIGVGAQATPFVVSLAVTHSILNVIPAILLGAPEPSNALGVLPGHRYLLQGNGLMAIKLTVVGSYFGLLIALVLIPVWWQALKLYNYITPLIGYALLIISAYMILRDSKRGWALLTYALSALIGLVLLNRVVVEEPLFPLFSGLFGVATLLYSLQQKTVIPKQKDSKKIQLKKGPTIQALFAGNTAGFLVSMLPGLGSAQAAILGMHMTRKLGDHGFLVLIGAIDTINFTLSLLTWLALERARNGAVVAMSKLAEPNTQLIATLLVAALIAASIAVPICMYLSRKTLLVLSKVNYATICWGVIVLITVLVLLITGWRGIIILVVATAIGLIPATKKCARSHAMGCLLFPVALYFL
ncbi:MAG: tripartite tricarboxylate transporter permease [Candidatus Woesearchaeota archaeon]